MSAPDPWMIICAVSGLMALCLMLGLKLISPKRFAQILAGLGIGLTIGVVLSQLTAGGHHG